MKYLRGKQVSKLPLDWSVSYYSSILSVSYVAFLLDKLFSIIYEMSDIMLQQLVLC